MTKSKGTMLKIDIEINDFPKMSQRAHDALQEISLSTARQIVATAVSLMGPPGPPSEPGQPPAKQTGGVAGGFEVGLPRRRKRGMVRVFIWNDDPTSVQQEFGTQDVEKRPFMRPAFRLLRRPYQQKINGLERYLRQRGG